MLEGLHSAAAGMAAQQRRLEALGNDVANVNTSGYKHVRVGFRDLVYDGPGRAAGPGVTSGSGAAASFIGRGFAQGALRETAQPFDLAIQGRGFFTVSRPDGTQALTRDGGFLLDSAGRLTTSSGALLNGVRIPAGVSPSDVKVSPDGLVSARGRALGQVQLVDVASPDGLASVGDNLFVPTAASGPVRRADGQIVQGALESSNVDIADAMVDMMDAQRSFQLASKAIEMADRMMEIANGVKR